MTLQAVESATYNIVDDKIRVSLSVRLPTEDYQRFKDLDFAWWPGQKLLVATWAPIKEDLVSEYGGTLEFIEESDDGISRSDRFQRYADNSTKWDLTRYWEGRAQSTLQQASRKENPGVITRRLDKLKAELRACQREDNRIHWDEMLWKRPNTQEELVEAWLKHHVFISRWIDHLEMRIRFTEMDLEAKGGDVRKKFEISVGDQVQIWNRWYEVEKVNTKTVRVKGERGMNNLYDKTQIRDHRHV